MVSFPLPVVDEHQKFIWKVFEAVLESREKDPLRMYDDIIAGLRRQWNGSEQMPAHGDWHHALVPGILAAVLRNNGYDVPDEKITEAMRRGMLIPAGACGLHGLCGAGAGIGVVLSVIQDTTPMSGEERSQGLLASSEAYRRIGKLGGPRCCVLSTYTSISLGARILREMGYDIPLSDVAGRCLHARLNAECHGEECPYHPRERAAPEGSGSDRI